MQLTATKMRKTTHAVSRNFRYDGEASLSLEFESQRMGISLNSLVNNIFRKYSEFDRLAARTDMITLNRNLIRILIDLVPQQVLSDKVFEFGRQTARDSLLFWKKEISIESLTEFNTSTLCDYCNIAEYDLKSSTGTFVLTHDMGPNGTLFLKSYIDGFMTGCLDKK